MTQVLQKLLCFSIKIKQCLQYKSKRSMMKHSINHILNKKVLDRYMRLPTPCNKILARYAWIDGSGINMRCKDRVLNYLPQTVEQCPDWGFDGSSCGLAKTQDSDVKLYPVLLCIDPFRCYPHILVLGDVYYSDGKPVPTNHRAYCAALMETHQCEDPWFGLEQEYAFVDNDGWGLGWPKGGGFPFMKYEYCYCGVGAKYVCGRDIVEGHARACLYAGLDFEGTNAEVMYGSWEWQIGASRCMRPPDHLWMSRYIMGRVAEDYGVGVTYHPKPFGHYHPGSGMHHNFSCNKMRTAPGGFDFIKECIGRLEKNHLKHMSNYGNECSNRMRMSGKFETESYDKFSWGIANRKASIRLQRNTDKNKKGFIEDRRPPGDCDPYLVCGLILETCLGPAKAGGCPPQPPKGPNPCPGIKNPPKNICDCPK